MEKELLPMTNSNEVRAELLSHEQIAEIISKSPIVYFPLGALEFHGPHLPIGLDGLTAHGVCVGAAKRSGGIVIPTMYQGTGGEHSSYPWTIMMPTEKAIAENLRASLTRFQDLGVQTTVLLSGHFADEQRALLKDLSQEWAQNKANKMRVFATSMADCDVSPVGPDHAGKFESLLLAALHPELVHIEKLPSMQDRPSVDPEDNPFGSHRHGKEHALWGVFGPDPRDANFNQAKELLVAYETWLAGKALEA
jgi:creatinine amidohydrolase